jgi:ribosomal protein S18 acetylase RimI-like enzyme
MLPPKEQAKVLFLCLLRSTAALTYSEHHFAKAASSTQSRSLSSTNHDIQHSAPQGHIALRLATRSDVPRIQRCNLATLPENYSNNFYCTHLRQWPYLALVAEHIPPGYEMEYTKKVASEDRKTNLLEPYDPNEREFDIVGYVLGKVEEVPISLSTLEDYDPLDTPLQRSRVRDTDDNDEADLMNYLQHQQIRSRNELLGHVTSLAILEPFRRCGLAAQLMKQLHLHMQYQYHAVGVGLNVRIGNQAARKLYVEKLGYRVDDVLEQYYQDGEDAFFMRKDFPVNLQTEDIIDDNTGTTISPETNKRIKRNVFRRIITQPWLGAHSNLKNTSTKHIWEHGPDQYRLPRLIRLGNTEESISKSSNVTRSSSINESSTSLDMLPTAPLTRKVVTSSL